MEVRTTRLVNEQPVGSFTQHTDRFVIDDDDMDSNTVEESDMSLKSRSISHRVHDRVRKMLDQSSKDSTQDSNKHSLIWEYLYLRHYKHLYLLDILLRNFTFHQKYRKGSHNETDVWHTWKVDSRTIRWDYGVNTINWIDSSWKHLLLIGDEEVISLSHVFSDSVLCSGQMSENPPSNVVWEDQLTWFKSSPQHRSFGHNWWWANEIRVEYLPRIHHIAALQ